jgi:TP901 family phage tail tape measure protein
MATSTLEYVLKLNTQEAQSNLNAVKSTISALASQKVSPLDTAAVQKAGADIAGAFATSRNSSQELLERQRQIVAAMALAGQSGSKEFKAAQNELIAAKKTAEEFDNALQKATAAGSTGVSAKLAQFGLMANGIDQISSSLNELSAPFVKFEATLADFSALTGVSGDALKSFGDKAKELSATFGGSASDQIESFKGILSRLGPDIAKSPEALEKMGIAVNTLSKASGLDATSSMKALTTSLLQFDVSLSNPLTAADAMNKMMNVLAAGAKEGAAEIPQVSEAVTAAGVAMSSAKISFEEGNAAIQVLASGGKYGAEAGTALRNVLGLLQKASGPAETALKGMGLSSKELANTLTTQGLQSAITQLSGGMNTLGSDAAKNAALMEIFGMENATAAGILIKKADQIGELKTKITGTDTAFAQADINMNTTAASIDRFKAKMEGAFISVFSVAGSGITSAVGALSSLSAPIKTISGIKSIIPEGSAEKIKTLGTSALSAVQGLTAHSIASGISTAATSVMTAAQTALNAAFVASPIGWVVLGVGALVGAMYLLYQNVEPVRAAFDKTWIVIKSGAMAVWETLKGVGSGIMKLFTGDLVGAAESFSSVGANAATAFNDSYNKNVSALDFDNAAKIATASLEKGMSVNVKINSSEALQGYLNEYQTTQDKINALKSKKIDGSITEAEKKELESLGEKAQETAAKIGKIAPESKQNFQTIVDASGNIKEVWDINIQKANEYTSTQKNNGELKAVAKEYSDALLNQVSVVDSQIARQKDLKIQIDATNDPAKKDELIKKYNEENKAIDETKQKIIANFQEGAKSGLLTSQAFDSLGKQLGITGEQAKKMMLSKELDEAAKKGIVTDSQIQKIADRYGMTFEEAKKITIEQQKITAETEKTKQAAMSWGDAVSEIKKGQEKAVLAVKEAKKAYSDGKISAKELKDIEAASVAEVQKRNAEMKTHNQITKEVASVKGLQIVQEETSAKLNKEAAKEKESAYDAAKRIFEQNIKNTEEAKKQAELNDKITAAKIGAVKTAKEETQSELEQNSALALSYQSQIASAKSLLELAEKTKGTKSKAVDIKDATARLDALETKAKELELKDLTLKIKIATDDDKSAKEIEKLQLAALKSEIEYKVKLGVLPQSSSIKFAISELNRQIESAQSELKKPAIQADLVKSEELKNKIQSLNYEIADSSSKLDYQLAEEKIRLIQDNAERARAIAMLSAEKTLDAERTLAGSNTSAQLAAYSKFVDEKNKIEQNYILSAKPTMAVMQALTSDFSKGFEIKKPDNSAYFKAAEEIKKSQVDLRKAYADGSISATDYYAKIDELDKKAAQNKLQATNIFAQALNKSLQTAAKSAFDFSQKQLAISQAAYTDSLAQRQAISVKLASIQDRESAEFKQTAQALTAADAQSKNAMDSTYSYAATSIASSAAMALAEGKSAGKAAIATAFDFLQSMVPIWSAQIVGGSLATPASIATLGIAGIAQAAALTLVITTAVQAAKASIIGFKHGGHTGGSSTDEIRGVVHGKEYVMPAEQTERHLPLLDAMRKGDDIYSMIAGAVVSYINVTNDYSRLEAQMAENTAELKKLNSNANSKPNKSTIYVDGEFNLKQEADPHGVFKAVQTQKRLKLQFA